MTWRSLISKMCPSRFNIIGSIPCLNEPFKKPFDDGAMAEGTWFSY